MDEFSCLYIPGLPPLGDWNSLAPRALGSTPSPASFSTPVARQEKRQP
jgi:hypothetical protein